MKKEPAPSEFILLTGLAQKINAPLKSLLLSSEKLLDTYKSKNFEYISYKDFKHMLKTLELMNKQIHRCYQTTQRLVNLHQSKSDLQSTNINESIKDILELLKQQILLHKIKEQVKLANDIPLVRLNRVESHQVIHNVLTNAIQAMPAGGIVKIRTSFDSKTQRVTVEIQDNGIGISPEHLTKVFQPFFTTRDQGAEKSSGLGLSVVHAIVQAAGGTIHVQSSLRKGTQVKIFLPIVSV
jgi:two-component system, NtrC family, sensor kinase